MYDVIYIDALGTETPIALDQNDRAAAADLARRAAAERGAGRVVLPWSTNPRNCVCVVPSSPLREAAQRAGGRGTNRRR
jgi:hypothetical protein